MISTSARHLDCFTSARDQSREELLVENLKKEQERFQGDFSQLHFSSIQKQIEKGGPAIAWKMTLSWMGLNPLSCYCCSYHKEEISSVCRWTLFVVTALLSTMPIFAAEDDCEELLIKRQVDEVGQLEEEYLQTLGIFDNPFNFVWSTEDGERLFARLTQRRDGEDWVDSPLGIVNTELKRLNTDSPVYEGAMIQDVLDDVRTSLDDKGMEKMDLQSNLLALQYSKEYLRRFQTEEEIVDRDGEKIEVDETEQQQEEQPPSPPEYPEMPKEYRPFTKDLPQGGENQTPFRVAEVNFKAKLFAGRHYGEIIRHAQMPFKAGVLPIRSRQPGQFEETQREMIVRTLGKREVTLFLPSHHIPLQPSDARGTLLADESGGYILKLKEDVAEIAIPLVEESNIGMMSPVLDYYTRPVGFGEKEWPEKIQVEFLRSFPKEAGAERPLEVARALARHLSKEYLYSVGARPETDPVDALKAGAFQCDMAAFIMASILRDVYQIPVRAVSGYPGQKHKGGADQKSYLVLPGIAHAWVEVFHAGQWHTFDPTPVKKDRKEEENNSKSEYSPWEASSESEQKGENEPEQELESSGSGESKESEQKGENEPEQELESSGSGASKESGDHVSRLEENTREGMERHLSEREDGVGEGELVDETLSLEEVANRLELGSLELEPVLANPLMARAMRVFLQAALNPNRRGEDIANLLNGMLQTSVTIPDPQFQSLYREALSLHSGNHPGLVEWVERLMAMMSKQELDKTHHDLLTLKSSLKLYGRVLDQAGPIPHPDKLLERLEAAYELLDNMVHPDAKDIGIVKHLVKSLPSVARLLLKRRYGLSEVEPNAPTMRVAKELKKGKLNDLRLMALLDPLTDFILNSSHRPESVEVKQWLKNLRRPMGRDLLPLSRPSDIVRALVTRPDLSLEDNINMGTAFVPTRRQIVRIPLGHGEDEAERITIVLYDTSGSMSGSPGTFQAGLISSFTAKALSDLAPSGRHRHRVVLLPFGSEPGTPVKVTDTAEALDIIDNYHAKLANTGDGTNIQAALMQAMGLIADAEKRMGEPLAAANIILMTDGIDDNIDTAELYRARGAFDRQTPLQTMFVAIRESNPQLMEFAMSSRSAGMEKGFYREFRSDHIKDILQESRDLNFEGKDYFYTDKTRKDIPREMDGAMASARVEAAIFSRQVRNGSGYKSSLDHLENFRKIKWNNVSDMERPLEKWLMRLRMFAHGSFPTDRRLLEVIVDDLMVNFETLAGTNMNTLGDYEQEQLRHLIRYAAGLEEKE